MMIRRTLREIFATIAGYRKLCGVQTAEFSQVRAETRSPDIFAPVGVLQLNEAPGPVLDGLKHYSGTP